MYNPIFALIGNIEKWHKLTKEYADKCKMLKKVNIMLLKENESVNRAETTKKQQPFQVAAF